MPGSGAVKESNGAPVDQSKDNFAEMIKTFSELLSKDGDFDKLDKIISEIKTKDKLCELLKELTLGSIEERNKIIKYIISYLIMRATQEMNRLGYKDSRPWIEEFNEASLNLHGELLRRLDKALKNVRTNDAVQEIQDIAQVAAYMNYLVPKLDLVPIIDMGEITSKDFEEKEKQIFNIIEKMENLPSFHKPTWKKIAEFLLSCVVILMAGLWGGLIGATVGSLAGPVGTPVGLCAGLAARCTAGAGISVKYILKPSIFHPVKKPVHNVCLAGMFNDSSHRLKEEGNRNVLS